MRDPVRALSTRSRRALAEHLGRLRHDLGKYISLQTRWAGPDASAAVLLAAVRADLLHTRRGPAGVVDAPTVWVEFRVHLVGQAPLSDGAWVDLTSDGDFGRLDAAMVEVTAVVCELRRGAGDTALVGRGVDAARVVAQSCRALHRRARED